MYFDEHGRPQGLPSRWAYVLLSGAAISQRGLIALSSALWATSITLIILRTAHRYFSGAKLHNDDIVMVIEGCFITAYQCIVIIVSRIGLRPNLNALEDGHSSIFLFYVWIGSLLFLLASMALKISLVLYWIRLCSLIGAPLRTTKLFLKGLLYFIIILTVVTTPALIFSCWPISTYWSPRRFQANPHSCVDRDLRFVIGNCVNAALNVIIVLAPLPLIRAASRGSVTWQKRLGIGLLYGLGLVLVLTSLMPVISLKVIGIKYLDPDVPTATNFGVILWSVIEVQLGPVVACIPTLMPFYHDLSSRCGRIKSALARKRGNSDVTMQTDTESTAPIIELAQRGSAVSYFPHVEQGSHYQPRSPSQKTLAISAIEEDGYQLRRSTDELTFEIEVQDSKTIRCLSSCSAET